MGLFDKAKLLFKTAPTPDMTDYLGRTVLVDKDAKGSIPPIRVTIEKIVGNVYQPKYFEINGKYLISMLRFFAQMNGDRSITEDQFLAFEDMEMHAERMKDDADKRTNH